MKKKKTRSQDWNIYYKASYGGDALETVKAISEASARRKFRRAVGDHTIIKIERNPS